MTQMLPFRTYDVFTTTRFAGNPLAIVEDADGLTTQAMQTIAREFNLSETIFVQSPADSGHTAKVRIFFPTAEIPFAGHPTIGCAIYLATMAHPEGDFDVTITLEEEAGLVPVQVTRISDAVQAEFVAPVVPFPHRVTLDPDLVAAALGLAPGAVGFGGHAPIVAEGGPTFLYAPLADAKALAAAKITEPAYSKLAQAAGCPAIYLYCRDQTADTLAFRARMYDPVAGIPEDPATGSASAILAAQLLAAEAPTDGEHTVQLLQGAEMGRPSDITLTIEVAGGALTQVRVAGSAVPVSRGEIIVPDA